MYPKKPKKSRKIKENPLVELIENGKKEDEKAREKAPESTISLQELEMEALSIPCGTTYTPSSFVGQNTTYFLANRVKKLVQLMENLPEDVRICTLDEDKLIDLLQESTQISMAVRDDFLEKKDQFYPAKRKKIVETTDRIKAYVGNDYILKLQLPPLIGRRFKGTYEIYWRVKILLEELCETHQFPQFKDEKLLLIYKKYSPLLQGSATCDNDNWEAGRVTNAISEALQYSDNSDHFSIMYTAVISEFSGTEALLIPMEKLVEFAPYLTESTPRDE